MKTTDLIELTDNKKYIVAAKVLHHDKIYLCLVEFNNNTNVRYGYLDEDEIVFIKQESIDSILLLKLVKEMTKTLKKMS